MSPSDPIVPTILHCPRCGSGTVTGRKEGTFTPLTYEYYCTSCQLGEERAAGAPDFEAWMRRWEEPGGPLKIRMTKEQWREQLDKDLKKKK